MFCTRMCFVQKTYKILLLLWHGIAKHVFPMYRGHQSMASVSWRLRQQATDHVTRARWAPESLAISWTYLEVISCDGHWVLGSYDPNAKLRVFGRTARLGGFGLCCYRLRLIGRQWTQRATAKNREPRTMWPPSGRRSSVWVLFQIRCVRPCAWSILSSRRSVDCVNQSLYQVGCVVGLLRASSGVCSMNKSSYPVGWMKTGRDRDDGCVLNP
jgi:hypothetical protein